MINTIELNDSFCFVDCEYIVYSSESLIVWLRYKFLFLYIDIIIKLNFYFLIGA